MNSLTLKIIACSIMFIGHIGYLFYPENLPIYILGRVGFPIFAFLIALGYIHTGNLGDYIKRLGLFAIISQIPYSIFLMLSGEDMFMPNILFSLVLGLAALILIESKYESITKTVGFIALLFIADYFNFSYGAYGILTILGSYVFLKKSKIWGAIILFVIPFIETIRLFMREEYLFQFFAIFVLIPMFLYNGKKGRELPRMWFYWFYPVHLVVLSLAYIVIK